MNFSLSTHAAVVAVVTSLGSLAHAAVPDVDTVFANHTKALGGETAIRAMQSRFMEGVLENKSAKSVSRITFWQKAPNLSRTEIETLGQSTLLQGYDGSTVWALDGAGASRKVEKSEEAMVVDSASLQGDIDWKSRYSDAKVVGETTFNSKPAVEVSVTTKTGIARSLFFNPTTWLQLGTRESITVAGPDGKPTSQPLVTTFEEYQAFGGVQTIVRFSQKIASMELSTHFTHVEVNGKMDVEFTAPKPEPTPVPKVESKAPEKPKK